MQLLIMLASHENSFLSVSTGVLKKKKLQGASPREYEGCGTSHAHGCTNFPKF
jgi:hypothetical protein